MSQISVNEFVRNPVTLVAAGFTAATSLLQVKVLTVVAGYLWGHIGELFTIMSLAGFTVAENVDFLPEDPLIVAAVLTGVAYGAKKAYEMATELEDELDS